MSRVSDPDAGDREHDEAALESTTPTGVIPGELGRSAVRGFQLVVAEGPAGGASWESAGTHATIGSNPSCDLILDDPTVSRFHCEIAIERGGARVRDLGSRNGTILDGTRVNDAYLKGGSLLRLGRSVIRFQFIGKSNRLAVSERTSFGELVGRSVAMRQLFAALERAAAADVTMLLEGETGTGKSATARSIHTQSKRSAGPFVMVDCGAIPANLLESELFGHEKGAFTGATAARVGAFEEADRGTIFLDEIGELPPALQPKLLGVLENRAIRRVGTNAQRSVDVRVIAATNRDLRAEVNAGRFREDLYFRLAVVKLQLPPLRARPEDLPELIERLLRALDAPRERIAALTDPALMAQLQDAAWPGNVRELRNYLEQCLVFDDALPPGAEREDDDGGGLRVDATLSFSEAKRQLLADFERAYITELLRIHGGKVSRAAAAAGVDRTYLYKLLRRHGIPT